MTNQEIAQLNKTAHKFGGQLMAQGIWWQRKAFNPKKTAKSWIQTKNFIDAQITKAPNSVSLYDQLYYVTNLENWKTIIQNDLLDIEKYIPDSGDCDNYAFLFSARASMIYGLNSCIVCTGDCYNSEGKLIRHAFNVFIVENNGILYPYLYEPQTDSFSLFKKDGTTLANPKWKYSCQWGILF